MKGSTKFNKILRISDLGQTPQIQMGTISKGIMLKMHAHITCNMSLVHYHASYYAKMQEESRLKLKTLGYEKLGKTLENHILQV